MSLFLLVFSALLFPMLLIYRLISPKKRYLLLLFLSLGFYLFSGALSFAFVVLCSSVAYFSARCKKDLLGIVLIIMLWAGERAVSAGTSLFSAVGLSFYALRLISYLIEARRGVIKSEANFLHLLLFASYFPMALLGPVAVWDELSESLFEGRLPGAVECLSGVIRVLFGAFKKCVIADALAQPLLVIAEGDGYSGAYVLLLTVLYSARIYCDFSGGIDMMLGASRLFGIRLPENFDRPFASLTLREFWNRWHITLGEWFERYVFFPLSLSKPMQSLSRRMRSRFGRARGRKLPVYLATLATWLLTGLWHGARANFVAWGLINGVLVIISAETAPWGERIGERYPRLSASGALKSVRRVRVFLVIGAVRLLDVYGSVGQTFKMVVSIFYDVGSYGHAFGGGFFEIIMPWRFMTVLGALFVVFLVSALGIKSDDVAKKPFLSALAVFSLALCVLLFGAYGREFVGGEFIYSRY